MDLSGLNEAQRVAVTAPPGPHLVIAGAGTGKTRTLVHRLAWLLDQGADPRGIVLLTFTRRAAQEMLARAAALVGPRAKAVRGGTFHGFAHTILRRHAPVLGWSQRFTILDRSDAEALVGMVRAERAPPTNRRRFPRSRTLLKLFSKRANTGRTLESLLLSDYPQYEDDLDGITAVGEAYAQRKKDRDLFDYDDLLVQLANVMKHHPAARQEIASRCAHVLVDEYQDTNRVQGFIAAMLASAHNDLMVVGDEAQSIYAFRGASVQNILGFPRLCPDARTTRLELNYRSTQPILDVANGVLVSAREGFDKRLHTTTPGGALPQRVRCRDEEEQAAWVVQQVLDAREEGFRLDDLAVLYRSGNHANQLELQLAAANIPYVRHGGLSFAEAAHVKDVLALLRTIVNPRDELSWFRVLVWFDRVGERTAERLIQQIVGDGAGRLRAEALQRVSARADLLALDGMLEDLRQQGATAQVATVVEWYRTTWLSRLYDNPQERTGDLDTLLVLADHHDDLEGLLAEVSLDAPTKASARANDKEDEGLVLTTIHGAKGLEWRQVFVLSLLDGAFPSGYALDDGAAIEEERRLLYVAVTRASERLCLLQPTTTSSRRSFVAGPGCVLLDDIEGLDVLVESVSAATARPAGGLGPSGGAVVDDATVDRLAAFFEV